MCNGESGECDVGNCLVASAVAGMLMVQGESSEGKWVQILDPQEPMGRVVERARCALSTMAGGTTVEVGVTTNACCSGLHVVAVVGGRGSGAHGV